MSGKAKPLLYWDSCVFLAWIQEEGPPFRKVEDMDGLQRVARLVGKGEMKLCTSVLTHVEILACKMDDTAKKRYENVFLRPEVIEIGVDSPIALLASELRDFYIAAKDRLPIEQRKNALTLSTPDAIHLATAIHYGAEEFHTFDGDDKSNPDGLLRLGNMVAKYPLKIRKPDDQQLTLLVGIPPLPGVGKRTGTSMPAATNLVGQEPNPVTAPAATPDPTAQHVSSTTKKTVSDLQSIPTSSSRVAENFNESNAPKNSSQNGVDQASAESNRPIPEKNF